MSIIINKIRTALIISTILMIPQSGKAQIFDFVEEMASEWAEQQVYGLVNNITGNIKSLGSQFWNDFVDYSARSSISEKAEKLSDFAVTTPQLSSFESRKQIVTSGGYINTDATISKVKNSVRDEFNRLLTSTSNIKFNSLGNGYIKAKSDSFLIAKDYANKIHELREVLLPDTRWYLDSIDDCDLKTILITDLNSSPGLIPAFNATPYALHFYKKLKTSAIRTDPNELLYWAEQADYYRTRMPRKNKLINPINLTFTSVGKDIEISFEDLTLATYTPDTRVYTVYYPEFLNFIPRPNHTYKFEQTSYTTEALGRIYNITFKADKKLNKSKSKNPVKFKDIAKAIADDEKGTFYDEILKDYNIIPSAAYAVKINQSKQTKDALKQYNKTLKKNKVTAEDFTITLKYGDFTPTPSSISISRMTNNPETVLYDNGSQPLNYSKLP
ncbi:MAG: hypothetical protein K2M94_04075 [Paramuribaculum sp.]|nr:hypothetical protein [Paramuribaculum sp.]